MKYFPKIITLVLAHCLALISMKGEERPTPLVGFMFSSDEWRDGQNVVPKYGFYQLFPGGTNGISPVSPISENHTWAKCGGTYVDNKYYCYNVEGTWTQYTLTYTVLDATSWTVLKTQSWTYKYSQSDSEESQKARYVPSAVGYDPASDKLYAFTHRFANSDDGQMAVIDRETGELSKVADTRFVSATACGADGQIFAIGLDGNLYKVSASGEFTLVGHTGYYPTRDAETNCGAAIDFRTGQMYWTFFGFNDSTDRDYNRNGFTGLLTVDTATGAASLSWTYPRLEYFSALAVQNAHPSAPDNIYDLAFTPLSKGSADGQISFTIPSVTYAQHPLTGDITVECFVDDVNLGRETGTPGQKYTKTIEGLSTGNHTASVVLYANDQQSTTSYSTHFFGTDTPQAVENFTLTFDENEGRATLTWNMPETGRQGGAIDFDDLRYQIVRMPGGVSVARSAKGTSFSEQTDYPFGSYYYRIQPYYNSDPQIKGGITSSNRLQMGNPVKMPYRETFDTESSMNAFTIIDANNDGGSEWEDPTWKYDPQYACAFYYGKRDMPADDWLITPALELNPDILYKLTYKYYAYYGLGSHIQVAVGNEPTVEGMGKVILDKEFVSSFNDHPGVTETVLFAPRKGDKFIGFHHLSQTMEHLSIDDIQIEEYMSATVPDRVTDITSTATVDRKAKLSFKLPTLTVAGKPLSAPLTVKIWRGDVLKYDAILKDKQPGETIEWIDETSVQAMNLYTVAVSNDTGDGIPAEVQVDLSRGCPVSVDGVKARAINNQQVEITWNPSVAEKDENGNPVDLESMRYLVYKPVPGELVTEYKLIGRDLSECRFIDDNPAAGYGPGQNTVFYYVAPVNGDDEGYAAASNAVFIGQSYNMPFAETWYEQTAKTSPWLRVLPNGATWYVRYQGYEPFTDEYKGVVTCESDRDKPYGMGGIESPRIDLSSMADPVLKFRMYMAPEYADGTNLLVWLDTGEKTISLPGANFPAKSDEAGWQDITIPLSEYSDLSSASVVFVGYVSPDNSIHIDEVSVSGSAYQKEIKITEFKVPASGRENEPVKMSAVVSNIGNDDVENVTVNFTVDNQPAGSVKLPSVAAGETTVANIDWTPDEAMTGYHTVNCSIDATDDNDANNSMEARIEISKSNYPYLSELQGKSLENGVLVEWGLPSEADGHESFVDDVEAYDSFAIDNVGSWTMIDLDQAYNYSFSNGQGGFIQWPNNNELQAFIVFDTSYPGIPALPFSTMSGQKVFASWPAAGEANNDFLVSPELPGNSQLISFYARTAGAEGSEPFNVMVSYSGTDETDFIKVNGDRPVTANNEWFLYHFALPEGTKYFAINYVGSNDNGLLIDDIMYYGKPLGLVPDGYNIYRDGIKLNTSLLSERTYLDSEAVTPGTYKYTVAPVFNSIESKLSKELVMEVSGVYAPGTSAASATGTRGMIIVRNADNARVEVYAAGGQKYASLDGSDYLAIPAAAGIYIVRINDNAVKGKVK